jgi:hypothetical protein
MAKAKKEKQLNLPQDAQPLDGCDFCMQFDYDDPLVIGASEKGDGVMEIILKSYMDVGITFKCPDTGKKLRLFARPLSDKGKKILEEQQNQANLV